jgi:serine protease Do
VTAQLEHRRPGARHAEAVVASRSQTAPAAYRALMGAMIALLVAIAMIVTTTQARAQAAPPSFADLVDQVGDAVVNITTSAVVASRQGPAPNVPAGSPLEDFFNDFLDRQQGPENTPRRSQALGSGFVISEDGFIVTNNHVIEGADEILIEFRSGIELEAQLIGTDPNTDIALLKVEADERAALRALRRQRRGSRGRLGHGHGQPARAGLFRLGRCRLGPRTRALGHL